MSAKRSTDKLIPKWMREEIRDALSDAKKRILRNIVCADPTLIEGSGNNGWEKPTLSFHREFGGDSKPCFSLYINDDQQLSWSVNQLLEQAGHTTCDDAEHIQNMQLLINEIECHIKKLDRKNKTAARKEEAQ